MTSRTDPLPSFFAAALVVIGGLALSACATRGGGAANGELARLESDCKAQGGVLVQSGRATGRETLDNICRITGGPSDRLRPQG